MTDGAIEKDSEARSKIVLRKTSSANESSGLRIAGSSEQQERREQFVRELEERYRRGLEPRIKKAGLVLESDATWETQLSQAARDERLLTCAIASFQNALRDRGVYDSGRDSQEQLITEVRDLFREGGGAAITALDRLAQNRSDRGVQIRVATFQQAVEAILNGDAAVHGDSGHMVFLRRIEVRDDLIGVRKVDPMKQVVKSEFEPLNTLAKEDPYYRVITISRPSAKVRLSPRS